MLVTKLNPPNARQHSHRKAARSPVDDMALYVPHGVASVATGAACGFLFLISYADFSAVRLTDELVMAFLHQLAVELGGYE